MDYDFSSVSPNIPAQKSDSHVGTAIITVLILGGLGTWLVIDKHRNGSWAPVRWVKAGRQAYEDFLLTRENEKDPAANLRKMEAAIGAGDWD